MTPMTSTHSTPTHTSDRARELVDEWRRFAAETSILWRGRTRSWKEHVAGSGYDDERQLLQPSVFPAFAARLLGWQVGVNLSPEQTGAEGRPDFTPADPVTHPFVFETKSSSLYQAIVDSLPPGNLRAEDILAIGVPDLSGATHQAVAENAFELAEIVHVLVAEDGQRFPLLPGRLCNDVSLSEVSLDAWTPEPGPSTRWGQLDEVPWVREVHVIHNSKKIGEVSIEETLLGRIVRIAAGGSAQTAVEVEIDRDAPRGTRTALAAMVRGVQQRGTSCAAVARMLVPTDANELVESYEQQTRQLVERAERYRAARDEIDRALTDELGQRR
jgi:hypothetical protein